MTFTESPGLKSLATKQPTPTVSSEVRAEQLEMLASQASAGTLAFLVNAGILCMVLWPAVPHGRLLAWYGLVLLLGSCRIVLMAAYRREPKELRGKPRWLGLVMAVSLAAGALWGMAGTILVPADNLMDQMFVAILLSGMAAGALPMLSAIWEVYLAYAIPTLIPMALWLAWQPDSVHHATGGLIGIFLVMMVFASWRHYVMVNETLRLRFENEQLQQGLNDAKVHAEVAAEELQAEIADRRKAQAALWQSEARFQKLIDQAADAFFLLDLSGRICEANQQACDSLGYSYEELVSLSGRDLRYVGDSDVLQRAYAKVLAGQTMTVEYRQHRKDGSLFPVEARMSLIEAGDERFLLALVRDVSERKKVERLKNEFISTVSHELRTPLTCIHASLAVLKDEHLEPLPTASKELVNIAHKNGEQLIRLINDLLDVQKIESEMMEFRFEALSLLPLVEEALATNGILAEREGVRLDLVRVDPGALVWADRGRLMQVIGNLLSNAIKFSHAGDAVELSVLRTAGTVRVEVRDHGPGIPEDFRDKVFHKFTQADGSNVRQKGGTGLGLSICQMILDRLNGRIGFESEVGQGSTFWFELAEYRG